MPSIWYSVRSKRPSVAVARYEDIGSVSLQRQVVLPAAVLCHNRTPLHIAVRPLGTVTAKSKVALSAGSSLTGYQPGDPIGSQATNAPSSVGIQPSRPTSATSSGTRIPDGYLEGRPVRDARSRRDDQLLSVPTNAADAPLTATS